MGGGRDRVKKKGETEVCKRSIEAAEMTRASGEMGTRGAEMVKHRWCRGGRRQALKDGAACRPKGSPLGLSHSSGVLAASLQVSLLLASVLSHFILFFILSPLSLIKEMGSLPWIARSPTFLERTFEL